MDYKKLLLPVLIDKCVYKDALAWAEFVRRFSPLISFSIKKALSKYFSYPSQLREDLKDIQQNIMVSLWHKNRLSEVKNKENINYWLTIIARNTTINHLKARQKEVLMSDESYFEKIAKEEMHETEDADKKIKGIYYSLSSKEKILFKLYFKKALSLKDISKIMNMPLGTVSSMITRIRKNLK